MKIKLPVSEIYSVLDRVLGVVERKSSLPVLSHVLIEVNDTALSMTASNSETEAFASIQTTGTVKEPGRICVEAKKLAQLLKSLPDEDQVTLTVSASEVKLSSGRSKFKLMSLPAEHFPNVDTQTEKWLVRDLPIEKASFLTCLARVSFAQGVNDSRQMLNGMLLELEEKELRFVCTDGHRLATTKIAAESDQSAACIVPKRVVDNLPKILAKAGDSVLISMSENHVEVRASDVRIVSQVIGGKYPNYQRVIPKEEAVPLKVKLPRNDMLSTLKLSLITSDEMSRGLRLTFDDGLTVESRNQQQEDSIQKLSFEWAEDPMTIALNGSYLVDALKSVEGEECEINMGRESKAVTIQSPADRNYKCVVMQMMI
jgi:DNA polymerase III subunit beta